MTPILQLNTTFPWPATVSILLIGLIVCLTMYLVTTHHFTSDFTSFYLSIKNWMAGQSPYVKQTVTMLHNRTRELVNLNPPAFLFLFTPVCFLEETSGYLIIQCSGLLLYIFTLYRLSKKLNLESIGWLFWSFSLLCFGTLLNVLTAQMGLITFSLIYLGWEQLENERQQNTAILWGIAAAIKLFPAFLIFHCLQRKYWQLSIHILIIMLLLNLIPMVFFKFIYIKQYVSNLQHIYWYGHSWNGSLLGTLSRLFATPETYQQNINWFKYSAYILGVGIFSAYVYASLKWNKDKHSMLNHFFLTIVVMLIINPLSWQYYFILLAPCFIYNMKKQDVTIRLTITRIIFMLTFTALPYHRLIDNHSITDRLLYSTNGIGLLLTFLLFILPSKPNNTPQSNLFLLLRSLTGLFLILEGMTIYGINLSRMALNTL